MMMKFTAPLPPSVNDYLGKKVAYKKSANGRMNPYVMVYEKPKAKAYKNNLVKNISRAAALYDWKKTEKDTYVICNITAYLSRKRRDCDNLLKCLLDGITESGIIYDDCFVIPRFENVFIDSKNPRIEVELTLADKKGIFSVEEYLKFIRENCLYCTRFERNCSLLKKICGNYIIPEIEGKVCLKRKEKKN